MSQIDSQFRAPAATAPALEIQMSKPSAAPGGGDIVPPVTDGPAAYKVDIPRLSDPMLGGVALEQMVEALGMKDRQNAVKDALSAIEAKGKEIKQLNAEKMEKIQEQLEKMQAKSKLSPFLKAFKWIGMVLGAIGSIATIVVAAVTVNPVLMIGGIVGLGMSINSMVSEGTDGKVSIAAGVAKAAEACGFSEETAKWIGFGVEIAIAVYGATASIAGGFLTASNLATQGVEMATKVVNYTTLAVNIANGVNSIAQGTVQIINATYDYKIAQAQAEMKDLEANLHRIRQAVDNEESFLEAVMERTQDLFGKVMDIVKGNAETQTAVLTGQAPSLA